MYQSIVALLQPFPLLFFVVTVGLVLLWRRRVETRRLLLLVTVPWVALWMAWYFIWGRI